MGIWKRRPFRLPAAPPPKPAEPADPKADFLAAPPIMRAQLDRDSEVSGKLSFAGPTRIDGRLRGEVRATDVLVIGESGFVDGTVRASTLIVLGHVEGQVLDAERVEIGPSGRLHGSIETRTLVVREGGLLDGDCRVAAPKARLLVLRPRAAEVPPPEAAPGK